ncbi:MAG: PorT family protein [Fibrobacter sp.]|nr:PorT family protein [Fibrobacter sp.]
MKIGMYGIKLVSAGLLSLLFCTNALAESKNTGIRVGGHAAIGYNTVWGVDEQLSISKLEQTEVTTKTVTSTYLDGINNLSDIGFNAGLAVLFPFTESIGLSADLLFAYRSYSADLTLVSSKKTFMRDLVNDKWNKMDLVEDRQPLGEASITQINIDVPLMCRYTLPENGFAEIGPQLTFNVSTSTDGSLNEEANGFVMGLTIGGGYPIELGSGTLEIDVHVLFGFMAIQSNNDFEPRNMSFNVGATYWFI